MRRLLLAAILAGPGCGRTFEITPASDDDPDGTSDDGTEEDDGSVDTGRPEVELTAVFFDEGGLLFLLVTNIPEVTCEAGPAPDCDGDFRWWWLAELAGNQIGPGRIEVHELVTDYIAMRRGPMDSCEANSSSSSEGELEILGISDVLAGALVDVEIDDTLVTGSFRAERCEF